MKVYKSVPKYIEAELIDTKLFAFLKNNGWTTAKIGDYYIKCPDGSYVIWSKKSFESSFEIVEEQ